MIMIIFYYDYEHYAESNNIDKFNNSAVFFYGVPILPRITNNRITETLSIGKTCRLTSQKGTNNQRLS